jgi:hypothetical protein
MTASRSFLPTVPADVRRASPVAFAGFEDFGPVVVQTGKAGYNHAQLRAAFSALADPMDCDAPIRVAIPASALDLAMASAVFMTGAGITVETVTADRWAVVVGAGSRSV